ncbi:NAD(P)-binding protein [Neurospora crassa]|nr:NAD(P)-binding protein [Neurospora crassa]
MSEPKVIIVTGGSKGIGLAVVQDLLKASHKVVLVARTPVSELAKDYPGQVTFLAADMTVSDTAHRAVELALISYGKLDGVVVNHGVLTPITRLADASIEDWKNHYDVNVFSALSIVKEAIPHLRATKGKIIFVSSGAAIKAYAAWGAYGSSKAALNSICRHVAVEEPNITAVAVSPGRVDTDMQKELREKGQGVMSDKEYADFVSAFEEGQLNKPEWPAQVIAKLSLDAKSDLSGLAWNSSLKRKRHSYLHGGTAGRRIK